MGSPDHTDLYGEPDFADLYRKFRPRYPEALFEYLASLVSAHDMAWDCGTGNGQAALGLADRFRSVVATDISPPQLVVGARLDERIGYVVAAAERPPLADRSVDLVTVALALHWFDLDRFYAEVRRVLRPAGVIACWMYHLQAVSPEIDAIVRRLYGEILGPFWLPQNRHVENAYADLPFHFDRIEVPAFKLEQRWDLGHLVGYLRTWSASRRYLNRTGRDPLEWIRGDLAEVWGKPELEREVVWPLHLLVGRV
jgi:SAM-dependent methyltransferase